MTYFLMKMDMRLSLSRSCCVMYQLLFLYHLLKIQNYHMLQDQFNQTFINLTFSPAFYRRSPIKGYNEVMSVEKTGVK